MCVPKFWLRRRIDTCYLIIASDCNFRCRYCFFGGNFEKGLPHGELMQEDLAKRGIRFFGMHALRTVEQYGETLNIEPSVVFYGGEPLMNPRCLRRSIEYIRKLEKTGGMPKQTHVSVNTNGSLLTKHWADFFVQQNVEVDVSIDGNSEINDVNRVYTNGSGTFTDIMRGLGYLRNAGTKTCISCTITEANVNRLPEVLNWFVDELGVDEIGFNPVLNSKKYQAPGDDFPQRLARALIDCYIIARERGVYESRIMRKVRPFVEGTIYDRDCCGCGRQIVITPAGDIGVCHGYTGTKRYFVPFTDDLDLNAHPYWLEWVQRSPLHMPECENCEALGYCGGGCAYNADIEQGSIWKIDKRFCIHSIMTLHWLIEDLYAQTIQ